MGRKKPGTYSHDWVAPEYRVDADGKIDGGYTPTEPNNWGRWGADDERGTQNLIGPAERVAAARLVRSGRVFSLALPIDEASPRAPGRPAPLRLPLLTGSDAVVGNPHHEHSPGLQWNDDMLQTPTQGATQWDALAHVMYEDSMYNGWWAGNVTAQGGGRVLGIETQRESFVGRGVLVDPAREQGLDRCPDGQVIGVDLLEACLSSTGTTLQSGDMLLVRTGYLAKWWELGPDDSPAAYFGNSPGLGRLTVPWLHEHDISAVACDNIGVEVLVPEDPEERAFPLHIGCLVDLGLPLGEFWELDRLADDCADDGVYEFLLVAPPLFIPGAMGSPLNPIALK